MAYPEPTIIVQSRLNGEAGECQRITVSGFKAVFGIAEVNVADPPVHKFLIVDCATGVVYVMADSQAEALKRLHLFLIDKDDLDLRLFTDGG
jgi:hypothetical protein